MTLRVEHWLRQTDNDLVMAGYGVDGGFHAQACHHASQAAGKALQAILISLDREPRQIYALEALVASPSSDRPQPVWLSISWRA